MNVTFDSKRLSQNHTLTSSFHVIYQNERQSAHLTIQIDQLIIIHDFVVRLNRIPPLKVACRVDVTSRHFRMDSVSIEG